MSQFPLDSVLYLDDDAIVRIDGLHEPRKEQVHRLTKKIFRAWELQQYELCSSLLTELCRLSEHLSPELVALRKRVLAKCYLQHLIGIHNEAKAMLNDGVYDSAYVLCEVEKEEFGQADSEDQEAIDVEFRFILLLRQTILEKWCSAVKQEILELLKSCSQESIQKAQNILTSQEGTPVFEGMSGFSFYHDLQNAVKNAWYKFYVQEAKKSLTEKMWEQAIEWAEKAQQVCADCTDSKRIVEQSRQALQIRRRKTWIAITSIVICIFLYLLSLAH